MINIKEKINNIGNIFKHIFNKFPVLLIVIFITTIMLAIGIDNENIIKTTVLENIMIFSSIFSCSLFLIETKSKKIDRKRIILYTLAAIIAFAFTYLLRGQNNNLSNEVLDIILRINICYCTVAVLVAIYFNYKNSNVNFEKYITHVATNIFKVSIIYSLLGIGIALITAVFIYLILNGKEYDSILRIEILLMGIYYIPQLIYSICNIENEVEKFIKILVKYVLDILLIIAFAIIYIYIGKIILLRKIPSNQIFRITAALFAIGCPIWTMANNFDDKKILDKINSKLPILFIPFILLQIYSIGVRIISNGITEARYLCIMYIILEIIYILIYIKNKEKIGKIIIVFAALILISLIIPYVNMYNIANISQYNNLKIYKEKEEYTEAEKEKIKGAYDYLYSNEKGQKLINGLLNSKDIETIQGFNTKNNISSEYWNNNEYIFATSDIDKINVEDYKYISEVNASHYYPSDENQKLDDIFKNIELTIGDTWKTTSVDLTDIITNYINNKENIEEYIKEHNEVIINANTKLIIKNISLNYNESSKVIRNYSIEGFLLEK